jgi:hypothetical protein
MKYNFLIIVVILFSCNLNQQQVNPKAVKINNDKCHIYPKIIDSLHLQDLYDSARWYIYTQYCDVLYLPQTDSLLSKPYGEIELELNNTFTFIKNDTANLSFSFIDKGKHILTSMTRDNMPTATAVGFDLKTRKKIYVAFSNALYTSKGNPKSRYENPLQPEVLRYIKENWDKLDNCFRELAEQKGITK